MIDATHLYIIASVKDGELLGPVKVGRILSFPELDMIRGDPRVKAIRKKVGLPE